MIDRERVVYIDTETSGLDPGRGHEIWELCLGYYDHAGTAPVWTTDVYRFPIDCHRADPAALDMNGWRLRGGGPWDDCADSVLSIVSTVGDRTLAGMNVQFDLRFLDAFIKRHAPTVEPVWDYHVLDVEAFVVGGLPSGHPARTVPWRSADISAAVGIDPADFERHTARGDVEWCRAILEAAFAVA